jgi:hypothetical protein
MTYREKIQQMIKLINSVYDDAEWMRDLATEEEKVYWNEIRKIFYSAGDPLNKLDNRLPAFRAQMEIDS